MSSLPTIHALLATTTTRWQTLANTLPAGLLTRPPAPGEWSALECLQHLVDTERWVFPVRLRCFLAGENFPAFDPDSQGTKPDQQSPPADLAADFARMRAESLALIATLTPADLARKAVHGELGPVTLSEMLHEWAAHDLMHTVQAERALMQPFIAECGPWKPYFRDHIAS
ncbi:MAG TPA: DinB family protein [Anaerolineales bacterium]|nr:DinB family protein [Anaerolineales bacterium]